MEYGTIIIKHKERYIKFQSMEYAEHSKMFNCVLTSTM